MIHAHVFLLDIEHMRCMPAFMEQCVNTFKAGSNLAKEDIAGEISASRNAIFIFNRSFIVHLLRQGK